MLDKIKSFLFIVMHTRLGRFISLFFLSAVFVTLCQKAYSVFWNEFWWWCFLASITYPILLLSLMLISALVFNPWIDIVGNWKNPPKWSISIADFFKKLMSLSETKLLNKNKRK